MQPVIIFAGHSQQLCLSACMNMLSTKMQGPPVLQAASGLHQSPHLPPPHHHHHHHTHTLCPRPCAVM